MEKAIYVAAALFNGRETMFNWRLSSELEKKWSGTTITPQLDGYEFSALADAFSKNVPPEELSDVVQSVIYYFDMGYCLPMSDIVIANLDEPLDEGVVTEVSYAKLMG